MSQENPAQKLYLWAVFSSLPLNLFSKIQGCTLFSAQSSFIGVSNTGSAKTGSAIDVRIDDAGSILNFRIGFVSSIGGRLPYPCLPTPFPILRSNTTKGPGEEQGAEKAHKKKSHKISENPWMAGFSLGHPAGVPAKMPFFVRFSRVNNRKPLGHRPVDPCLSHRESQVHPVGVPGIFLSLCALFFPEGRAPRNHPEIVSESGRFRVQISL